MRGHSHLLVGLAGYLLLRSEATVAPFVPSVGGPDLPVPTALSLTLALVAAGALAPDIDHPDSEIAQVWRGSFGMRPLHALAWVVRFLFGHRGVTHSAWLTGVVAWLVEGFGVSQWGIGGLGASLGFGMASHLLADGLTRAGVPLLWPLPWRFGIPPIRALRLRTGGPGEHALVTLLTLAAVGRVLLG
ncbi:MAG: metal-dependent hydrolase [Chloroflexi bacterium]|nr:metal-dependent hydrolase [Chloroflexota bacterium]